MAQTRWVLVHGIEVDSKQGKEVESKPGSPRTAHVTGTRRSCDAGDFTDAFRPHMSGVPILQSIATTKAWKHMLVDLTQGFIQDELPKGGKYKNGFTQFMAEL